MNDDAKAELKNRIQATISNLPDLIFETLPLENTYKRMQLPIYIREPGCWAAEPYGSGKTSAIKYCVKRIKIEFPDQAVFFVNEQVLPGNELRSFFVRALNETGVRGLSISDKLRNLLALQWAALARKSPLRCVILFLDEGQAIRETDENLIKDLGNSIAEHGGALQTIILGESPAFDVKVAGRLKSMNGAIERIFGGHHIKLFPYKTKADWRSLFDQMHIAKFEIMDGKTVYESLYGVSDLSTVIIEEEVHEFWLALKKLGRIANGMTLRKKFEGIRLGFLKHALSNLDQYGEKFEIIKSEEWIKFITYSAKADKF